MKYIHNTDGSTTIQYTKEEAKKYHHYRERCEEMLKHYFCNPNDMERVYNVLVALAEIGSEDNTDELCALETQIEALGGTIE